MTAARNTTSPSSLGQLRVPSQLPAVLCTHRGGTSVHLAEGWLISRAAGAGSSRASVLK